MRLLLGCPPAEQSLTELHGFGEDGLRGFLCLFLHSFLDRVLNRGCLFNDAVGCVDLLRDLFSSLLCSVGNEAVSGSVDVLCELNQQHLCLKGDVRADAGGEVVEDLVFCDLISHYASGC